MAATADDRFRQAAGFYVAYGIVYWLGGLVLAGAGLDPRPTPRWAVVLLFVTGAGIIALVPWLLWREHGWFDRWVLSRRDFARILTVLVGYRAVEVFRIARAPVVPLISVGGFAIPVSLGAGAFFLVTVTMAVLLARAGWSRHS